MASRLTNELLRTQMRPGTKAVFSRDKAELCGKAEHERPDLN